MVANLLRYHTVVAFVIHQLIRLTKERVEWFTVPGGEREGEGRGRKREGEREYENNMIHTSNSTTK